MAAILFPELQFHDENGVPLASGTIETYVAGTSTPTPTYTDNTGGTSVGNSITLDAEGRPNSGNGIWLGTTTTYKFIIKDSGGNTVQTIDNISSGGFNGSSSFITATSESGLTDARVLTEGGGIDLTDAGAGSTMTVATQHPINSQTGTTYTVVAADRGKVIRFSTQSTCTATMTAAATLGDGFYCHIINANSGTLTVTGVAALSSLEVVSIYCNGSSFYSTQYPYSTDGNVVVGSVFYEQNNPAQITASQNNYSVSDAVNILTSSGAYNITGLVHAGGLLSTVRSTVVYLVNSSAFTLTLKHEDASSTAANRFKFSTGADIALAADETIALIYDNTADRWRNIPV